MQARFLETEEVLEDGYRKIAFIEGEKFIVAAVNSKANAIEYGYNTGKANLEFSYIYTKNSDMWKVFKALTRTSILECVTDYMNTRQLKEPTHPEPIQRTYH